MFVDKKNTWSNKYLLIVLESSWLKNKIGAGSIVTHPCCFVLHRIELSVSGKLYAILHRSFDRWIPMEVLMEAEKMLINNEAKGDENLPGPDWLLGSRISLIDAKLENCHYQMRIAQVRDPNDKGATWQNHKTETTLDSKGEWYSTFSLMQRQLQGKMSGPQV